MWAWLEEFEKMNENELKQNRDSIIRVELGYCGYSSSDGVPKV